MTRGLIVWVDLSDAHPPEMGKVRPAVIVSNSIYNASVNTVVVVPLSTQPPEIPPLRVKVRMPGKREDGFAVVPGIRQVRKSRLGNDLGRLSPSDQARLDEAVRAYLGD